MDPTSYFGKDILSVLEEFRASAELVEYSKVENDEFLKAQELGFYLHSKNGKIFDARIYFSEHEGYYPSFDVVRGKFAGVATFNHLEKILGKSRQEIKSIKIPGRPSTLPGRMYDDGNHRISAFSSDGERITFLHIKLV